jgi:hypothetical protein
MIVVLGGGRWMVGGEESKQRDRGRKEKRLLFLN